MSNNAVMIQSLSKKYGKKTAVTDFSLTLQLGEIHALVGPTGSGKTTILNILAGTVKPSNGTVKIMNKRAGSLEAQRAIGYVPENPLFYSSMTVLEYLVFMGMLSGMSRPVAIARATVLLKQIDLHTFKDKNPLDLTPGMKTKIAIIQSLLSIPSLLLLDEPVKGLDQTARTAILEIIKEFSDLEGLTVLIASAYWQEAADIADRMTLLHEGKILTGGETESIRRLYRQGVFSLQTSDNDRLLAVLQRMTYLRQIIRTEKGNLVVITEHIEQFKRDLPGIVYKLELEMTYFQQEEINAERISQYLLSSKGD